jgi:hypothetical protein
MSVTARIFAGTVALAAMMGFAGPGIAHAQQMACGTLETEIQRRIDLARAEMQYWTRSLSNPSNSYLDANPRADDAELCKHMELLVKYADEADKLAADNLDRCNKEDSKGGFSYFPPFGADSARNHISVYCSCGDHAILDVTATLGDVWRNGAGNWSLALIRPEARCDIGVPVIPSLYQPPSACRRGAKISAIVELSVSFIRAVTDTKVYHCE